MIDFLLLFALFVVGLFILTWHRLARGGFGAGWTNRPLVVRDPCGCVLVWLAGILTTLTAGILLWRRVQWYWVLVILLLAYAVARWLVGIVCRKEIAITQEIIRNVHDKLGQ